MDVINVYYMCIRSWRSYCGFARTVCERMRDGPSMGDPQASILYTLSGFHVD